MREGHDFEFYGPLPLSGLMGLVGFGLISNFMVLYRFQGSIAMINTGVWD
ncbi:hypothetical protein RchiOBHm_Chr6g0290171 [Rosa chinensis]|uniref:Uncharacterized protein n=1 Tax=Rosa chinensis TaxID=74649 RepID=A0A2P6PVS0_ROSCH|nr:hypothetical protein RchiOBHm_Chr6g0290171 [Rosa chinensis]